MLDALGREYLAQYVWDSYRQEMQERSYQVYVTNCLRLLTENTAPPAAFFTEGQAGQYLAVPWLEAVAPAPQETRTPEEIIAHIRESLKD